MRTREAQQALTAVALVLAGLGGASPAAAHPSLVQSSPATGVVAESPPREVRLAFSEDVVAEGSSVTVTGPRGRRVPLGKVRSDGASLVTSFRQPARPAVYRIRWVALGSDGHTVSGDARFGVAGAGGSPPPGAEQLSGSASGRGGDGGGEGFATIAFRWLGLLGAALLVGGFLLLARVRAPDGVWRGPERVALALVLAAAAQAVVVASTGGGRETSLDALLASPTGQLALARLIVVSLCAAVYVARPGRQAHVAAFVAGVAGVAASALDGHVAVADDRFLAGVEALIHTGAAAVWAGGLLAIGWLGLRGVDARKASRAYAPLAIGAFALLVVTGVLQAVRQVDGWYFLRWSDYGNVVAAKSVIAVVVAGLGAYAFLRSRPAHRFEMAGAVVLLAVAATLAGQVQGRGQPRAAERGNLLAGAATGTAVAGDALLRLTLSPARPGDNEIVALADPRTTGGARPRPGSVTVTLGCACSSERPRVRLSRTTAGTWRGRVRLPDQGAWFAYARVGGERAVAPVTLAVGVDEPGPGPVELVQTADLSGPRAEQCRAHVQGVALALARANAQGGVDGRKLTTTVIDDRADPAKARAAVADRDPEALIAPCGAGAAAAVRAAARKRLPAIVADPGVPSIRAAGGATFRSAPDPEAEGYALGAYLSEALPASAPRRIAVVAPAGADALARREGLRRSLAGRQVTVVPRSDALDDRELERILRGGKRYAALVVDEDGERLAAALARIGRRVDPRELNVGLYALGDLATEAFQVDAGRLGRTGLVRVPLEVSPDSRDALGYATAVQALFPGERGSMSGLRGYVAGLALGEGVADGVGAGRIAARLQRPRPFTDALLSPWRADRPGAGSQRFTMAGSSFLPPNLMPQSVGGMARTGGAFFDGGAWTRLSAQAYGPPL